MPLSTHGFNSLGFSFPRKCGDLVASPQGEMSPLRREGLWTTAGVSLCLPIAPPLTNGKPGLDDLRVPEPKNPGGKTCLGLTVSYFVSTLVENMARNVFTLIYPLI